MTNFLLPDDDQSFFNKLGLTRTFLSHPPTTTASVLLEPALRSSLILSKLLLLSIVSTMYLTRFAMDFDFHSSRKQHSCPIVSSVCLDTKSCRTSSIATGNIIAFSHGTKTNKDIFSDFCIYRLFLEN